jgi:TBC1 domain family protein 5
MPEYPFFRELSTKDALLDILFIYCKLNAEVGYRQGMHELLAPIFWVVSQDAVDHQKLDEEDSDELMLSVLDSQYIEHDAFTIFCIMMQTAKSFYDTGNSSQDTTAVTSTDSPIITRSQRIYNGYLRKTDRELMNQLKSIDILPQIFIL